LDWRLEKYLAYRYATTLANDAASISKISLPSENPTYISVYFTIMVTFSATSLDMD